MRLFAERYLWLRDWARRLSDGNHSEADDLVHDAFVQFVLRGRDLAEIENLEAYLYGLLRRLHLSHARKALRRRHEPLATIDYDNAELCLRGADARELLQVQQDLSAVCDYACLRKDASKAGSVLILRFFQGYYPSEIARILGSSSRLAHEWLRIARNEARAYLEDPSAMRFAPQSGHVRAMSAHQRLAARAHSNDHRSDADILRHLRGRIRDARTGVCLSQIDVARLYHAAGERHVCTSTLSHIVSCPECLDLVARHLDLGQDSDRDPMDVIGPDDGWRANQKGAGSNGRGAILREGTRRLRALTEHRPAELLIAANGLLVGALKVRSAESELEIAVNLDEAIDFIEILSEQHVRLLLFEVEHASRGGVEQTEHIAFADGRSIHLTVNFAGAWPTVHLAYHDPAFASFAADAPSLVDASESVDGPPILHTGPMPVQSPWSMAGARWRDRVRGIWRAPFLRPAFGLATLMAAVVVLWTVFPWRGRTVSARELLRDARASEQTLFATSNAVVHRVLIVEERRPPARTVSRRQRVEVWYDGRRGLSVRRLYDERNRVAAGEWISPDGTRTIYRPGVAPETLPTQNAEPLDPGQVWAWDPSAQHFTAIVPTEATPAVENLDATYRLRYRADGAAASRRLVEATLTIRKADMRALAQTLVVRTGGELREYEFTESALATLPVANVPSTTFEPESELVARPLPPDVPAVVPSSERPRAESLSTFSEAALTRLEVDAVFALHRLESCLVTPVALVRDAEGRLRGRAGARTAACREGIAHGVTALGAASHLVVDVLVADPAPVDNERGDASPDFSLPFRTLVDRLGIERARTQSAWFVERSSRALAEARELERLVAAWPVDRLRTVDADRVTMVLDVMRDHARRSRRESEPVREQLAGLFAIDLGTDAAPIPDAAVVEIRTVGDVPAAAARLTMLAAAHEVAMQQAFDPALRALRVPVDLVELVRSLIRSEHQAFWFDEPWRAEP